MTDGELFECLSCGKHESRNTEVILNEQDQPYIPFYALMCKSCGKEGRYICKGNLISLCKVIDSWCEFHSCEIS